MSIEIPNLDDRSYEDLVEEAISILQRQAPAWTNHNPSDPGITLIELLAYFAEILIFRLNQITLDTQLDYLRLLRGPDWNPGELADKATLEGLIQETLLELRSPQRAVTAEDYVALALDTLEAQLGLAEGMRACCSVGQNLADGNAAGSASPRPGHVSLSILPHRELDAAELSRITETVERELRPKCLITTRLHVVGPCIVRLAVAAEIHLRPGGNAASAERQVQAALCAFLNPYDGSGPRRQGWPFGRSVYLSELIELVESVAEVDFVENVRITQASFQEARLVSGTARVGLWVGGVRLGADTRLGAESELGGNRLIKAENGRMAGIALRPHEVAELRGRDVALAFC